MLERIPEVGITLQNIGVHWKIGWANFKFCAKWHRK
jgi:hypothetical protein